MFSYAIDPYVFAFHSVQDKSLKDLGNFVSTAIVVDILLNPFVGRLRKSDAIPSKKGRRGDFSLLQSSQARASAINDPLLVRDVCSLLGLYARSDMIFDIIANAPIVLYWLTVGYPVEPEDIEESKTDTLFIWCLGLKLVRIAHVYKVKMTLTHLVDKLSDVLHWKKYVFDNLLKWSKTLFSLLIAMHYLACAWVFIQMQKRIKGEVYHEFSYDKDIYNYSESIYFITTTITTVGYGDIKGFFNTSGSWTIEMCYLIVTTFTGILLFTVVTEEVFNYNKFKTLH